MPRVRIAIAAMFCTALALASHDSLLACTAFCAAGNGQVLVGNNEDWNNPRTKIWFVPATPGSFGRLYVGFDDLWPQGGMNEHGLWFDGFATAALRAAGSSHLPGYQGNLVDKAMAECRTVEEVIRLFSLYNRSFLTRSVLMFADASGDAASIEPDAIVRKTRRHFVQTNFHQSLSLADEEDGRFRTATSMLEQAGDEISVDLFRRILAKTYQKGGAPTLYSNLYDLKARTMHLYFFHDFERAVTFDLAEELKKGKRVLDIPALFPPNAAAEAFAATRRETGGGVPVAAVIPAIALLAVGVVGLAVFAWIRTGTRLRIGLAALAGLCVLVVGGVMLTLNTHRQASDAWIEFAIGPASGENASISTSGIHANGITLKAALATAYDVPAVRIIAPGWLTQTRYSIKADVGANASDKFRSVLQEELKNRLGLESHFEVRPFDVFVLTAKGAPRLERSAGSRARTWIQKTDVQMQDVSMKGVVSALQSILGKPVIDETGLTETYNIQFEWRENRVESVTAVLRDRFGLQLTAANRQMEALVVDSIHRDVSMVLLAQVGRMTRRAPPELREQIARVFSIR
jgi:uncharacterized protein (TIGR03435 family)